MFSMDVCIHTYVHDGCMCMYMCVCVHLLTVKYFNEYVVSFPLNHWLSNLSALHVIC